MSEPNDSKSARPGANAENAVISTVEASHDAEPAAAPNSELVENEPYLGPAWAVAMLILYALKETFPATEYSLYWWFQLYVVGLVVVITIFALVKRHQFYTSETPGLQAETTDAGRGSSAGQGSDNHPT